MQLNGLFRNTVVAGCAFDRELAAQTILRSDKCGGLLYRPLLNFKSTSTADAGRVVD
jgi:hypothetical protein